MKIKYEENYKPSTINACIIYIDTVGTGDVDGKGGDDSGTWSWIGWTIRFVFYDIPLISPKNALNEIK